jgi:very-short-patch-repair endonuclease
MLETPEVSEYSMADQLATRLRETAPRSEKIILSEMLSLGFLHSHPVAGYVADFYHPELKLDIEIDGPQHRTKIHRYRDGKRQRAMAKQGVKTYRYPCSLLYQDKQAVIQMIRGVMEINTPV